MAQFDQLTWVDGVLSRTFAYAYVGSGPNQGLLETVTLSINGQQVRQLSFQYDAFQRVTSEAVRGGSAITTFAYLTNLAAPAYNAVSVWNTCAVVTLPDGNQNRVYANAAGQPLANLFIDTSTGETWVTAWQYNSMFRLLQEAQPSAVASVIEPTGGAGALTVVLNPDSGLLRQWTYYDTTDDALGAVLGFIETLQVCQGTEGAPEVTDKWTYNSQTVNGYTTYPVRAHLTYPVAGTPDEDAPVTTTTQVFYEDGSGQPTFAVQEVTTTPPIIPTDQNGTGLAEPSSQVFDEQGRLIWARNARGFITFYAYDEATDAMIQQVNDVDTSLFSNVPAGWVTPEGGGLNLITDYINDAQGRNLRTLQPWIEIDPATVGVESDVPLGVRPVTYTFYRDTLQQVWSAQGYLTGDGEAVSWFIIGPVSITLMDSAGNTTDSIQVPPCCACGPLGPGTFGQSGQLPPQCQWTRWTHNEVDLWGRILETRVYHTIPAAGTGFSTTNYDPTTYAYDVMNRQYVVTSPGGTITQTVFDAQSRPIAKWVGTNNAGATPSDPSGGGTPGNNMQPVWLGVYDNGEPGDGNLTQVTLPVDTNSADDRITNYTYDYRDRQVQVQNTDGTTLFFLTTDYDNLDRPIDQARYYDSVATANRTHYSATSYDDRSRAYEQQKYYVNTDGSLGAALTAQAWFDPNGNAIKQVAQGANAVTKTVFDSLDRSQTTYQVSEDPSTAGENTNSVALDVVIAQSESLYNDASQVIATTDLARFDDATGTGPLQGPSGAQPMSRNAFIASYLDPVGRLRFTANFGTNGAAPWTYPTLHSVPSAIVLVSEQRYVPDGQVGAWIDPQRTVATEERDQAGRRICRVENAEGIPGTQRTSQYSYAPDGGLQNLILENPTTGQQVTTWAYGTTLATSGVARSDLMVSKTYPTGELELLTYNRQGEVFTKTDPNGSVHAYDRDLLARLINDRVPILAAGVDGLVRCISTAYDMSGHVSTVTSWDSPTPGSGDIVNQVALSYNGIDCLTADAQAHSGAVDESTPTVGYTCTAAVNNQLRRTSVTYPNGRAIGYEYGDSGSIFDVLNRVQSVHDTDLTVLAEFAYVGVAMPSATTLPQPNVLRTWKQLPGDPVGDAGDPYTGYDRFGRTEWMRWVQPVDSAYNDLVNVQWGYNQASLKTWRKDLLAPSDALQDQAFAYDGLYQVAQRQQGNLNISGTAVGGIPSQEEDFAYDETGNWVDYQQANNGALTINQSRVNNPSNQITQIDGSSAGVAYDANGNMVLVPTGDALTGTPYTLVWDAWNRLRQILDESGDTPVTVAEYQYDGRTRRTVSQAGSLTRDYYYDDRWRSVEEHMNGATTPERQHVWHPADRSELILRDRSTANNGTLDERLYSMKDQFDPVAICTTVGTVQERYTYTTFGVPTILNAGFTPLGDNTYARGWNFLFHSEFADIETGWMNYGYRYFVSALGRWTVRDPLGEGSGMNLFAFVSNDSINKTDQFGLAANVPGPVKDLCEVAKAAGKQAIEAEKKQVEDSERQRDKRKKDNPLDDTPLPEIKERGGRICCNGKAQFSYTGFVDRQSAVAAIFSPPCASLGGDFWNQVAWWHIHPPFYHPSSGRKFGEPGSMTGSRGRDPDKGKGDTDLIDYNIHYFKMPLSMTRQLNSGDYETVIYLGGGKYHDCN